MIPTQHGPVAWPVTHPHEFQPLEDATWVHCLAHNTCSLWCQIYDTFNHFSTTESFQIWCQWIVIVMSNWSDDFEKILITFNHAGSSQLNDSELTQVNRPSGPLPNPSHEFYGPAEFSNTSWPCWISGVGGSTFHESSLLGIGYEALKYATNCHLGSHINNQKWWLMMVNDG